MADVGDVQQRDNSGRTIVIEHGDTSAAGARERDVVRCLNVEYPAARELQVERLRVI
jgi:hypothetical protein